MDIRFKQLTDFPRYAVELDFLLSPLNLIEDGLSLQSAVIVALGTDARADPSDDLPDPGSTDRRGWWGDVDAEEIWGGWPVGSKLWLLKRAKITSSLAADGGTVFRAQNYAREALQPFIDAKIATSIDVSAERVGVERIDVPVTIRRGPLPDIDLRWSELWDELVAYSNQQTVATQPPAEQQSGGTLDFSVDGNPLIVTI